MGTFYPVVLLTIVAVAVSCSTDADNSAASQCEVDTSFCNGFELTRCVGGTFAKVDCAQDCASNGYELYGCLDYDGNGIDECVCQPPGEGPPEDPPGGCFLHSEVGGQGTESCMCNDSTSATETAPLRPQSDLP